MAAGTQGGRRVITEDVDAIGQSELCSVCGTPVPLTRRACSVCNTDAGFPNVRAAVSPLEADALERRYTDATTSTSARSVSDERIALEAIVKSSKAVMNRRIGPLSNWMNGDSPLFNSFYDQIEHSGRDPDMDNDFDPAREAAESAVNPYCYRNIIFAALTADGNGMSYYGPYSVILKTITIQNRSSIFEQNPFEFFKVHHIVIGQPIPRGYRSSWTERSKLAVAKLHSRLTKGATSAELARLVMEGRGHESNCDFLEVHIYGPVNRAGIESISGPEPQQRADRLVWKQIKRKAAEMGIEVRTIP